MLHSRYGATPLMLAAYAGNLTMIMLLMDGTPDMDTEKRPVWDLALANNYGSTV